MDLISRTKLFNLLAKTELDNTARATVYAILQGLETDGITAKWEIDEESGESICSNCGGFCTGLIDKPQQHKNGVLWALVTPPYCARCGAEMEK